MSRQVSYTNQPTTTSSRYSSIQRKRAASTERTIGGYTETQTKIKFFAHTLLYASMFTATGITCSYLFLPLMMSLGKAKFLGVIGSSTLLILGGAVGVYSFNPEKGIQNILNFGIFSIVGTFAVFYAVKTNISRTIKTLFIRIYHGIKMLFYRANRNILSYVVFLLNTAYLIIFYFPKKSNITEYRREQPEHLARSQHEGVAQLQAILTSYEALKKEKETKELQHETESQKFNDMKESVQEMMTAVQEAKELAYEQEANAANKEREIEYLKVRIENTKTQLAQTENQLYEASTSAARHASVISDKEQELESKNQHIAVLQKDLSQRPSSKPKASRDSGPQLPIDAANLAIRERESIIRDQDERLNKLYTENRKLQAKLKEVNKKGKK